MPSSEQKFQQVNLERQIFGGSSESEFLSDSRQSEIHKRRRFPLPILMAIYEDPAQTCPQGLGWRWFAVHFGAGWVVQLVISALPTIRSEDPTVSGQRRPRGWPIDDSAVHCASTNLRPKQLRRGEVMKTVFSVAATVVTIATAITWATSRPERSQKIVGLTADEIRWFTPPYYKDGRQRAQMFGDSSQDGAWIDRVKIPGGARVLAHTHPQDELVTVIEGTWYLGEGAKFDSAKLKGYPASSFIVIPAGIAHFAAAKEGTVVVQLSGNGRFKTEYLEQ